MARKHEFVDSGERVDFMYQADWIVHRCKHCGKVSGLNEWQIKDMPVRMAKCHMSPVRMGFFEWLFGRVNCLGKGAP